MSIRRGSLTSLTHLYTAFDCLEYARRQVQGSQSAVGESTLKDAILEAYLEFSKAHPWLYLKAIHRFSTVAPYSTGTVTYTHSTRTATFSSGALPAGMDNGTLRISGVDYEIERRVDASTAILDSVHNPGANVAASAFVAYVDTYTLPPDFMYMDDPVYQNLFLGLKYVQPQDWLHLKRFSTSTSGYAFHYTIMPDPRRHNQYVLRFWPYPSAARQIDIPYQRWPRPIVYFGTEAAASQGSIVTAGTASIVGTNTAFNTAMTGSVLRASSVANKLPTGREGDNLFAAERVIQSYTSATAVTVDDTVAQLNGGLGVKYMVTDPIDLDQRLLIAFKRCVMKQSQIVRHMRNKDEATKYYDEAFQDAADANQVSSEPWCLGDGRSLANDMRLFGTGSDAGLV